jgi:phosphinothricin acetyltransferase
MPISVRDALAADAAAMFAIYEPLIDDTFITFETESPGVDAFAARVDKSHEWLVADDGDRVVGYAYAAPFHERSAYRWSAEVSVYIHEDHRGAGVGRILLQELLKRLTDRGFVNVFGGVALPNDGSVRLFESFGFERIALQKEVGYKLGRWIDVGWWQKHLGPRSSPPPELLG